MTSTSTVLMQSNESVFEQLQFAKLEVTHRNLISANDVFTLSLPRYVWPLASVDFDHTVCGY